MIKRNNTLNSICNKRRSFEALKRSEQSYIHHSSKDLTCRLEASWDAVYFQKAVVNVGTDPLRRFAAGTSHGDILGGNIYTLLQNAMLVRARSPFNGYLLQERSMLESLRRDHIWTTLFPTCF